jgi:hypothetical protein|eukprot:COSAG06_NODE_1188_length_10329_cov_4.747875_6_plen_80_part_00
MYLHNMRQKTTTTLVLQSPVFKEKEEKRGEEKSIVLLLIGCLAPCGELRLASRVLDGGLLPQLVTACTQTTGKLCSTSL